MTYVSHHYVRTRPLLLLKITIDNSIVIFFLTKITTEQVTMKLYVGGGQGRYDVIDMVWSYGLYIAELSVGNPNKN